MDAHTRQQAWDELALRLAGAGVYGYRAVVSLRKRYVTKAGAHAAARNAAMATRNANRALDLLDQLRGE